MKKTFLLMTTAFLLPLMAHAEDAKTPSASPPHEMGGGMGGPGMMGGGMGGMHHEMSLEEARKHAHEMADKLDKMTPEDWKKMQERKQAFMEKMNKMSPEEREKFFKERREHMEKWQKMTPEEREKAKAKWKSEHGKSGDDKGGPPEGGPEIPGAHD